MPRSSTAAVRAGAPALSAFHPPKPLARAAQLTSLVQGPFMTAVWPDDESDDESLSPSLVASAAAPDGQPGGAQVLVVWAVALSAC